MVHNTKHSTQHTKSLYMLHGSIRKIFKHNNIQVIQQITKRATRIKTLRKKDTQKKYWTINMKWITVIMLRQQKD